jgi:hypothetical protein
MHVPSHDAVRQALPRQLGSPFKIKVASRWAEYLLLGQMELGVLVRCLSYLKRLILPQAAINDVDGTLLDSVDLHAIAWQEALTKFGHKVSFEQVRSQIGKGGDKLIPVFLSPEEQNDHARELEEWRSHRFKISPFQSHREQHS